MGISSSCARWPSSHKHSMGRLWDDFEKGGAQDAPVGADLVRNAPGLRQESLRRPEPGPCIAHGAPRPLEGLQGRRLGDNCTYVRQCGKRFLGRANQRRLPARIIKLGDLCLQEQTDFATHGRSAGFQQMGHLNVHRPHKGPMAPRATHHQMGRGCFE